jgi:uncharacterized membrane protein YesL
MRSLLNPESPAMRFLTKIGYTIILNLLWFLCSLPLFTIGASTTALYAVMQKLVRNEESGIASAFFTAFRQNFKQATKIWLVLLAALFFLGFDGYILLHLRNLNAFWTILTAVWFVLAAACVIVLLYVFPLTARFNNTTFAMIRNSLMTGMHFLFCTVLIALFHFTVFYIIIYVYTPVMFLGEGLCALFSAWIMNGVLLQLEEISNAQNQVPSETALSDSIDTVPFDAASPDSTDTAAVSHGDVGQE